MLYSAIDYRCTFLEITASLARTRGAISLEQLIAELRAHLHCDAAFLMEQSDRLTATCRLLAGGDSMISSISDPALLSEALREFKCAFYADYRRSSHPDQTLVGWGAESVVVIPAEAAHDAGAALVLVWRVSQSFPPEYREAVSPVWALVQAVYPREKTEGDLARARERLSAILETIPEAVVFIDDDGERGWLNGPAAELFQLPPGITSPLRISSAMWDLRAKAVNSAAIQQCASEFLRNPRAEIRDWKWEFENPRRVLSVSGRLTDVRGVFGRIWVLLDITALTEAESAVVEKEERWQLALQGTNQGIWDWNVLTGEVFYSARWKEMLGYDPDEIPGHVAAWKDLVHPDDILRVHADLHRHLERETDHYEAEYRIRCRDGSWKWLLARGKAVWNAEGQPLRVVGTHSDITLRRRAEELMCEAKRAADEANSAKSQFLARMSHEIRTPMNAICGLSEMLLETPLNQEQREYVDIFRTNADRLLRLINNILDLSRVEASALDLDVAVFHIEDIIRRVRDLFIAAARQKGLALAFTLDPRLPRALSGDPDRLEQILVNLVGNAMKFTESGGISVCVTPNENGLERGDIVFEVRDTGPGIREDQLPLIFEPFVQADSLTTRKNAGSGLGLSIARKLVEKMGGVIMAESEFGKGCCFRFNAKFEIAVPEQATLSATRDQHGISPDVRLTRPARVLIAEDNEANRFVLRAYLKKLPFELEFAEDGAVALRKALEQSWDLILMDMQMPEADGLEVVGRIRASESLSEAPNTPIIAVTAFALQEEAARCLDAGCTEYLAKPVRKQELINAMLRNLTQIVERTGTRIVESCSPYLLIPEIRDMIPGYLADCKLQAETLSAHIDSGDFESIQRQGHNLKGSGGSFGMPAITQVGEKISESGKRRDSSALRELIQDFRLAIADGFRTFETLTRAAENEPMAYLGQSQ